MIKLSFPLLIDRVFQPHKLQLYRYRRNGILPMLRRNLGVKTAPQRWQENAPDGTFDVVLTFEEKVFDMVVEGPYIYEHHYCSFLCYNCEVNE